MRDTYLEAAWPNEVKKLENDERENGMIGETQKERASRIIWEEWDQWVPEGEKYQKAARALLEGNYALFGEIVGGSIVDEVESFVQHLDDVYEDDKANGC